MLVTGVEQQRKNKERYSVFIDGEFAFGLIKEDIEFFKIKEGKEIEKEKLDYIKETVLYLKAQDRALNYLSYKKRTEKEIIKKLEEQEYDEEVIEKVMEFLKKYNYVNDLEYAQSFIRQSQGINPKGRFEIYRKLRELGVGKHIVDEALENEEYDEFEGVEKLLIKKLGERRVVDIKEKKKLHDFLTRRGYSYGIIKEVFNHLQIKTEKEDNFFE